MGRTAPLTSKRCILYIYSTNIGTEYFKYALYSLFFSLQNAVCFIMLTCLVSVLFTFYVQDVPKLKKKSGAKGLITKTIYSFGVWNLLNGDSKHCNILDITTNVLSKGFCSNGDTRKIQSQFQQRCIILTYLSLSCLNRNNRSVISAC